MSDDRPPEVSGDRDGSGSAPRDAADTEWFREPTPREHGIGAALFAGFGVFFVLLFVVSAGWWFRWVVLGLAAVSVVRALWHARRAWRPVEGPSSRRSDSD